MTEVYDHLVDDWRSWSGILNESQAKQIVKTWAKRSFNQPEETRDMAKSLFVGTVPATFSVVTEAADEESAAESIKNKVKAVLGATLGVITIVGDPKVVSVAGSKPSKKDDSEAKSSKKSKSDDDDKDEEEEEEDEDEEEEEEEEEDEDEEEEDEDGEEEEEEEKPAKKADKGDGKSSKKSDKGDGKPSKKSDKDEGSGKKKIKLKLKG